jgi:hypothetical protein
LNFAVPKMSIVEMTLSMALQSNIDPMVLLVLYLLRLNIARSAFYFGCTKVHLGGELG